MLNLRTFDYTKMPLQAQAVLLIGAISIVMAAMQTLSNKKNMQANLMVLLATVLAVTLSTYNVRCLVRGNCNRWATVVAVLYVLTQGTALLAMK
jgi:Co/Zn/Cd efflux system component